MMVMLMMILMMSHREVSIFRPFGYEPNALPLRHDAGLSYVYLLRVCRRRKMCEPVTGERPYAVLKR